MVQLTQLCGEDIPLIDAATVSAEPSPLPPKRGTASTTRMKRCSSSLSRHIHLPLMVTQTPAQLLSSDLACNIMTLYPAVSTGGAHARCGVQELSPDVFQLRAPIVSLESLVISPTLDTEVRHGLDTEAWPGLGTDLDTREEPGLCDTALAEAEGGPQCSHGANMVRVAASKLDLISLD